MLLIIDNYDSFTYNLAQAFMCLGQKVKVIRNDKVDLKRLHNSPPDYLVISPGPSNPKNAGQSLEILDIMAGRMPILGVCLGHQCIIEHFGGKVVRGNRPVHGKASLVKHDSKGVFAGLDKPFMGGRYHSLIAEPPLPDELIVTATTADDIIMGVRHKNLVIEGIQFHPESVLTDVGTKIMKNFINLRG